MTTPGRVRSRVTARLRAITERSRRTPRAGKCTCRADDQPEVVRHLAGCPLAVSRQSTVSFERSHRDMVWIPPDPPLRWFREQGSEPMPTSQPKRWWSR